MTYSFNQTIEQAKKDYGLGKGEYLKIQEGDNRIRILSQSMPHESEYKGTKNVKFVTWVLDRKDGVVKPYFMPLTILEQIAGLQLDPDWEFDNVPMPYDINIKAINAGTKEVKYSVIASPNKTELTADEEKAFDEKPRIEEFVQKLAEKENKGNQSQPNSDEGIDIDDIPFD